MDVKSFNQGMITRIAASGNCAGCPLLGRKRVGMDASDGQAGPCAILFLGLNPGREEALQGLPFVGKSGRFLRECLAAAGIGSWAMLNSILCATANESEIPDLASCQSHCRKNVAACVKVITPKVIVPCGNGAGNLFGLGRGITTNSKLVFVSRGRSGNANPTAVLPLVHPSSLIRNGGKSSPGYMAFMERLTQIRKIAETFDPQAPDYNLGKYQMLFGQ